MKRSVRRCMALGLSIVSASALLAGSVYGSTIDKDIVLKANEVAKTAVDAKPSEVSKDENVYVLATNTGNIKKVIVSDYLRNAGSVKDLNDVSYLEGIENVKGDETFAINDNKLSWESAGADIYYQGTSNKELPVDITVKYYLDDQEIAPEELLGKSGKVKIRYNYTNNMSRMVNLSGKEEKMYVPFAALTTLVLDDEVFTNVEVVNGKVISDGMRNIVVGMAFPGVNESLGLGDKKLLPEAVEISADVKDFKLGMSVSVVTNEVFNNLRTGKVESAAELEGIAQQLKGAFDSLMTGSEALSTGLSTLYDGSVALNTGITQLSDGLDMIASNNDSINAGAYQVFASLLSTSRAQLVQAGVDPGELTVENYAVVLDNLSKMLPAEASAKVLALKASLDNYNTFYQGLSTYTASVASASEGCKNLKSGSESLMNGAATLSSGASELSTGLSQVDFKAVSERIVTLGELSKAYNNYSGISDDMSGEVRFIYRMDGVEKQ